MPKGKLSALIETDDPQQSLHLLACRPRTGRRNGRRQKIGALQCLDISPARGDDLGKGTE